MQTNQTIRHAMLIENTVADALAPLVEKRSVAMLPVAGKTLIQFWCEHLSLMGIDTLQLFVKRYPEQLRAFVGLGERWGIRIELMTMHESLDTRDICRFILPYIKQPVLIAGMDRFPVAGLASWCDSETAMSTLENEQALASIADLAIVDNNLMQDMIDGKPVVMPVRSVEASQAKATRAIASPRDFWQINMDVLNGRVEDPLPAGYEIEAGLQVEAGVQIKPGFAFTAACRLGRHSLIDTGVSLGESVVIGADSIIDRNSSVNESVIFDHTYIGSHSELNRIIADGPMVYHVDLDQATWIDDPAIVGSTRTKPRKVSFSQRLAALFLLAALLVPVVAFYLGRHLLGKTAVVEETLYLPAGRNLNGEVNYRELVVLSLDVDHPAWRKVIWLSNVIKGDLALVGTSAQQDARVHYPEWAVDHIWEMPGIINLADFNDNDSSHGESRFVSDAYYLATRGLKTNMNIIFRWIARLFTANTKQSNHVKFKGV